MTRDCEGCGETYPLEDYPKNSAASGYKDPHKRICRDCHNSAQRDYELKRLYSISREEYETVLEFQGGVCAICKRKPSGRRLHVDHNHKTLVVRGLLCWACNSFLGKIKDDPVIAANAVEYLTSHPLEGALGRTVYSKPRSNRRRGRKIKKNTEGAE